MKVFPLISKWRKHTMIFEALLAFDTYQETGDREGFKLWRERWKKELTLIDECEGRKK